MSQLQNKERPLYIGLAGMGTVGSGLVKLLQDNENLILRRTGRKVVVRRILVRNINKARTVEIPDGCELTTNPADLTNDPEIELLVELMGGIDAAYQIVMQALEQGKHVVTANKALLAVEGASLFQKAEEKVLELRFEASVAGAIPIIGALRDPLAANRWTNLLGILNGTSNYILSEMTTNGLDFDVALRQAQELGYAEADPTLDIDGYDTAHKLTLLIRMAFGVDYPYAAIPVRGIRGISIRDINMAREFGYRIKLIAQARRITMEPGSFLLEAGVFPALVQYSYLIARVGGVYNAVRVESESSGPLFLHGRGAGSLPTASVVLSDILSIARGDRPNNTGFAGGKILRASIAPEAECKSRYYVRLMVTDAPGVLRDLAGCMAREGISVAQAIQKDAEKGVVPFVFMTHETTAQAIKNALQHTLDTGLLHAPVVCYKVL